MSTPTRKHLRQTHGERGASLVIALVFISVFGLMLWALSGFADTNVRSTGGYRSQRATNYATDAALECRSEPRCAHDRTWASIRRSRRRTSATPTNGETVLEQPGVRRGADDRRELLVAADSGSGEPADIGDASPYALLTLGDRRTTQNDGTVTTDAIGVRNTEPPPYNGNSSDAARGDSGGSYQETGIRRTRRYAGPLALLLPDLRVRAEELRLERPGQRLLELEDQDRHRERGPDDDRRTPMASPGRSRPAGDASVPASVARTPRAPTWAGTSRTTWAVIRVS